MMFRKLGSFFFEITQTVVFAISIFLFFYLVVIQPHKIKGSSMEPNFHDGEYLLTDKMSYRFGEPRFGDIIVFKAPPTYQDEFIKRIIAIPGDTVMIQAGQVLVNGQPLVEGYLTEGTQIYPGRFAAEGQLLQVPQNSYFVMGDNREHSLDSRNIGFIPRDKITGKAWFVYWPIQKAGIIKAPAN